MKQKKLVKNNIALFLSIVFLTSSFYIWLDKPFVYWINDTVGASANWFKSLTFIADGVSLLAVCLYGYCFWQLVNKRTINKKYILIANSIAITEFLKNVFKFVFGRFWPASWQANIPSLLSNNAYGFHFFHSGVAYQSFPSGHTATIFAFATIMWCLYPKFRFLYIWLCLLVPLGLVVLNYHFLSDIIAGAYLGNMVALSIYRYVKIENNNY